MNSLVAVLAIFFSATVFAQNQPSATYIGPHRIGETFQEWLDANQMDLTAVCASKKREDKTMCKTLSAYRDGGSGSFFTTTDGKTKYEWIFAGGKVTEAKTGSALDFYAGGTHWSPSNMQEQIRFLSQVYGSPTKVESVPYQNALGGKWDCLEATWNMPDGAVILATESITSMESGPDRSITVRFISKERLAQFRQPKPNPYAIH